MPRLIAATVLVGVVVGTLGCSHGSTPTVSPGTAAQTLASVYKVTPTQQQCLQRGFTSNRSATRPLAANRSAKDTDLAALGDVARACIPTSTLAAAILGGAGQGTTLSIVEQGCLRAAVGRLSNTDRATMLAGLAVPTALGDLQTALLGRITDGLLNTCRISIPGVNGTDTTA